MPLPFLLHPSARSILIYRSPTFFNRRCAPGPRERYIVLPRLFMLSGKGDADLTSGPKGEGGLIQEPGQARVGLILWLSITRALFDLMSHSLILLGFALLVICPVSSPVVGM